MEGQQHAVQFFFRIDPYMGSDPVTFTVDIRNITITVNSANKSDDKPRKGLGESARKPKIDIDDDDDDCPFDV